MADKKISQLTSATTPLAGTEVLPIVQSGSTVKISAADITAGRAISAASVTASNLTSGRVATVGTSGLIQDDVDLQFNGQDLGVGTAPKTWTTADFYGTQVGKGTAVFGRGSGDQDRGGLTTNAYHDGSWKRIATGNAAQYYQNDGNHTFYVAASSSADSAISWLEGMELDATNQNLKVTAGNLVIGTAAKGIDFSANTGAAGETSALLDWYEEGTWTATLRGSTTAGTYELVNNLCTYTRVGRLVTLHAFIRLADPITGGGSGYAQITGLPFTKAANSAAQGAVSFTGVTFTGLPLVDFITSDATSTLYFPTNVSGGGSEIDISGFGVGDYIRFTITYLA